MMLANVEMPMPAPTSKRQAMTNVGSGAAESSA
jgi:hypothetical protein